MAEAEDVITDAARHATIYARDLWLRHRGEAEQAQPITLTQVGQRLTLMLEAALDSNYPLRRAQAPGPTTLLTRIFRRHDTRPTVQALPATDGVSIWLPGDAHSTDPDVALNRYRAMALSQAMRARRGSASLLEDAQGPATRAIYLLLEAQACDQALARLLPGSGPLLTQLRRWMLPLRPPVASLPAACRPLEEWTRAILQSPVVPGMAEPPLAHLPFCPEPFASLQLARQLAAQLAQSTPPKQQPHSHALVLDCWTGDLLPGPASMDTTGDMPWSEEDDASRTPRSARLPRRPRERQGKSDEDDDQPGVWMVQTAPPLEKAEDPMGLQRPADRDEDASADEYADALSELPEARLVSSPGKPKEVLVSDDPPDKRSHARAAPPVKDAIKLHYPEWDYKLAGYRQPGALVHLLSPEYGPQAWVDKTLAEHRSMLDAIRRRFEMLRPERQWLRRQLDGDEIDLDACTEGAADLYAGLPMPQALYRQQRPAARGIAITLLIDISGSTDSWIGGDKRIIDIERVALLLVSLALERMGEPYSILAFSGEGPGRVTVSTIKSFEEAYGNNIALRIAALEPQYYTRAGAALRHATAQLMRQPAQHRLLLLLSDGKPNDIDEYEGRYGIQDMRMAVTEAKAQGIFPFCLTIDRQAAAYLPAVFGARQYGLLNKPELLPTVLLEWMRRLVSR